MTFSITALDRETGATGVATMTGSMAVGALVPHCRTGLGAIATQGLRTNWLYGERGLELLEKGLPAQAVLDQLTGEDEGKEYRQCIIVDQSGQTSAWTGRYCEKESAVAIGDSCIAAGNWLTSKEVPFAMIEAFEKNTALDFSTRLLNALEAGLAEGGDSRGVASGALLVDYKDYAPVNLRIDNQLNGVLDSLMELHEKYRHGSFKDFYNSLPSRKNFSG